MIRSMSAMEPSGPLDVGDVRRIRETWIRVSPLSDVFALTLYRRLFEHAPRLKALFHTDISTQSRRVFDAFSGAVAALADWPSIRPFLVSLGRRHAYAGVVEGDFDAVRVALHRTFEDLLGPAYGPEEMAAWDRFYRAVASEMLQGLRAVESEAKDCDTTRFFRSRE